MLIPPMCEVKTYEQIKAEMVEIYKMFVPAYIINESDTVMPLLEAFSYREMMLRNLFNAQITGSFWQTAIGADLDFIAGFFGVGRGVISVATHEQEQINESDEALRERIALSFEGHTTAGSINSYKTHTLKSSALVDDVNVLSLSAGVVEVVIHSINGMSDALVEGVALALNADDVRPLTDDVRVLKAVLVNYDVQAVLKIAVNADTDATIAIAKERLTSRLLNIKIGETVTISAIISALSVDGVMDVTVLSPSSSVAVTAYQVAKFSTIVVSNA